MKKIALLLALFASYAFGATLALATGFSPVAGGIITVALSSIANSPVGALRSGVDISEVQSQLGTYLNVPKNAAGFYRRIYNEIEIIKYARKKSGQVGRHVGMASSNTEVLQAFQKAFTEKGGVTFNPYISTVFRLKVDILLDNVDEIYDSYLHFLSDETVQRKDWPLVKYIVEHHIIPSIIDELNIASVIGRWIAPVNGVAGNSINSMDGSFTIISRAIDEGAITPIITGDITSANAVEKIELFADSIDTNLTAKGGVIFCSHTVARYYRDDYRNSFGSTNDKDAKNNSKLDNYNMQLVPLLGLGVSKKLMFTPSGVKGNLLWLYDKILNPTKFDVQQHYRDVAIMGDFNAGVGFETLDVVYTNDLPAAKPFIYSPLTLAGSTSAAVSYQIKGESQPTSFAATGLPSGLSVNTTTGVISGTAAAAGTSNVTISATNALGTTTATLVITIS